VLVPSPRWGEGQGEGALRVETYAARYEAAFQKWSAASTLYRIGGWATPMPRTTSTLILVKTAASGQRA